MARVGRRLVRVSIASCLFAIVAASADEAQAFPGPTPPGTVKALYNPATGDIHVSVNSVLSWYVESKSVALTGAPAILPAIAGTLKTDNDARIGQSSFGAKLSYQDHNLGPVAATGLRLREFYLRWSTDFGAPEQEIQFPVPEPAGVTLAGFAAAALVALRRRRDARGLTIGSDARDSIS